MEPLTGRGSDHYGARDFFNIKGGGRCEGTKKWKLASAQGSFRGPGPVRVGFPAGRNVGLQVWGPQFEVPQFEVPQIEVPEFGHAQVEGGQEGGEVQLAGRSALCRF